MSNSCAKSNIRGSFRDPSGHIFCKEGVIYRQVNTIYKEDYEYLMGSGLYSRLVKAGLLVAHEDADAGGHQSGEIYKVIKPEKALFISYPYEWCFSQLREAALATLLIEKQALGFGMTLKDSSAYNIQFRNNKPVLIDTLSFKKYREGEPWIAYRQFCQHFLAPLALMCYRDIRLNQLFRVFIEGIPLDLASSLLPFRTRFDFSLLTHIHLHSKSQRYFADKAVHKDGLSLSVSRLGLSGLINDLTAAVRRLKWMPPRTGWVNYYEESSYSGPALENKKELVTQFLDKTKPGLVWDLGGNIGFFGRIAAKKGIKVISFDNDPVVVEKNYIECVKAGESEILPLLLDLTNPSPAIGWENAERMSITERGPCDTAFALALIHHLAISNNLPLDRIAEFFNKICSSLIIEFVPKDDPQVKKLLMTREDIFGDYTQEAFEREFRKYFTIRESANIRHSARTIYLMTTLKMGTVGEGIG